MRALAILAFIAAILCIAYGVWYAIEIVNTREREAPKHRASSAKKVYCKDCKHFRVGKSAFVSGAETEMCLVAKESHDPVSGVKLDPSNPRTKNRNFDCPDYTPPGAERIRRTAPGPRSAT
jgi:hypothetical protein